MTFFLRLPQIMGNTGLNKLETLFFWFATQQSINMGNCSSFSLYWMPLESLQSDLRSKICSSNKSRFIFIFESSPKDLLVEREASGQLQEA